MPAAQQPPVMEQAPAPAAPAPAAIPISQQQTPASLSTATAITPEPAAPFAFADFTWLNGNPRTKDSPLDTKFFTGEFRVDTSYIDDFNHPVDHTLSGTSESGRTDEFQVQQLGVGGDFHYDNVQMRLMTQFGMFSTMTPRNDASPVKGQWDLDDAYRYISEAYGGYHLNVWNGINIQAGIFMSYVGLLSYYNFDNWAYQPSYVSSNTPWFFNGMRIQIFPTRQAQDRALADQRLAVVRQVQQPPRAWACRSSGVPPAGSRSWAISTRSAPTRSTIPTASGSTPTTASRSRITTTPPRS